MNDPAMAHTAVAEYVRGGTQKASYRREETMDWPCPLCGAAETKLIKAERGALRVVECASCSLIRVSPRIHHPDEIYRGDVDVYREEFRQVVSGNAPHHRDRNYKRDLELLTRLKPTGNFLDIGTNTGSFLRLARGRGWTLKGVEPSPVLGGLAREWWDLDIVEGFIEKVDLPAQHYDIITMTDVFEHVVNPRVVLEAVRRLLKRDGILFIKVPNARFNVLKYKARSALGRHDADDFDSYEHVCHYTHETLERMLAACGLRAERIFVETPVQVPVWHHLVGHYYQHRSPWSLAWKTYAARAALYELARAETAVAGNVGWLAPNIGCIARVAES